MRPNRNLLGCVWGAAVLSAISAGHDLCAITPEDARRYVEERRWIREPLHPAAADLRTELDAEIRRMLDRYDAGGHLKPAYFSIGITGSWILYGYPGEQAYILADALPYLPPATQTRLRAYLHSEIRQYDPSEMGFEHCDAGWGACEMTGNRREFFTLPRSPNPEPIVPNLWPPPTVPPEGLYMIWRYCDATGDWDFVSPTNPPSGPRWNRMQTMFQAIPNPPTRYGHIAGAIGFARILRHYGLTNTPAYATALARVRAGMQAGTNFDAFVERSYADFLLGPHDWAWTPFHYTRTQNAVGAMLAPEIGRFLNEFALSNVYRRVTYNPRESEPGQTPAIESLWQGWYLTRGHYIPLIPLMGYYGENHMVTPDTPWAMFMTHAWVYNENGDQLRRWLDVPYCIGDLFHIQRLTATIAAYGAPVWSREQPPPLTPREQWRLNHFGTPENTGLAADSADPDNDGAVNLLEYALAGNPLAGDAGTLFPVAGLTIPSSTRYLTLTYRQNKAATDLVFEPQATGALTSGAWSSDGIVEIGRQDAGAWWAVTARDSVPMDAATTRFMRLKVSGP